MPDPTPFQITVVKRDVDLMRMALIYLQANLDDALIAFEDEDEEESIISVNGNVIERPTEVGIALCLNGLPLL